MLNKELRAGLHVLSSTLSSNIHYSQPFPTSVLGPGPMLNKSE